MPRYLTIAIILASCLDCAMPAEAQVVGTRPSKGELISVVSAGACDGASHESTFYEWFSFDGVQVSFMTTLGDTVTLEILGATTATGTYRTGNDPAADKTTITLGNTPVTYVVGEMQLWAKFRYTCGPSAATLSLLAIGLPTVPRGEVFGPAPNLAPLLSTAYPVLVGGLNGSSAVNVLAFDTNNQLKVVEEIPATAVITNGGTCVAVTNAAGGTVVLAATMPPTPVTHSLVQNIGIVPVQCTMGPTVPVYGSAGTVLKADTGGGAAPAGDGGSVTWPKVGTTVTCIASGAGGEVCPQRW